MADDRDHRELRPSEKFLEAIGIDSNSPIDVKKRRETIRWTEAEQEARLKLAVDKALDVRERRSRDHVLVYGCAATLFSIFATALFTHFVGSH